MSIVWKDIRSTEHAENASPVSPSFITHSSSVSLHCNCFYQQHALWGTTVSLSWLQQKLQPGSQFDSSCTHTCKFNATPTNWDSVRVLIPSIWWFCRRDKSHSIVQFAIEGFHKVQVWRRTWGRIQENAHTSSLCFTLFSIAKSPTDIR